MENSRKTQLINLASLLDFSARLNETYDETFILNAALLSLMGKLKILRSCVLIPFKKNHFKVILNKGKLNLDFLREQNPNKPVVLHSIQEAERILKRSGYVYFLPIIHQDETLAVISLGSKAGNESVTEEEEQYLSLVCTITANALQNARNHSSMLKEKQRVEQRNQLLSSLFEVARDFSTLLSRDQILKMLSHTLMGQLMASRFAVLLLNGANGYDVIINRFPVEPDEDILNRLYNIDSAITTKNPDMDEELRFLLKKMNGRIVSPMKVQGSVKGFLIVGRKMSGGPYDEQDLQFTESLGNTAIAALENERLFKEEVEKKKLEGELELALEIQKNLLPKSTPVIKNFDLAGVSIPSRHVGGDYFDFIELPSGKILIAIGDVSGKGMPASLLMANVQASLRLLAPLSITLVELILKINLLVWQNTSADKFITFFCAILDPGKSEITYVNAGHNPPYLIRKDGQIDELRNGGLIIGFTDEPFEYETGTVTMDPGDYIYMFTDGVNETLNEQREEFGNDRLLESLMKVKNADAITMINKVIDDVKDFAGNLAQYDDITSVVLRRL